MDIKKITRAFLALILPIVLLSVFTGCTEEGEREGTEASIMLPDVGKRGGVTIGGKSVELIKPERMSAAYLALDEVGKKLYEAAYTAVAMNEYAFEIAGVDLQKYTPQCSSVMMIFYYDHPELFWLDGGHEYNTVRMSNSHIGNITVVLGVHGYWKEHDLEKAKAELDLALNSIVEEARAIEDDYERILFVHDYLIEKNRYDYYAFEHFETMDAEAAARVSSAYGGLVKGSVMCAGYTTAFNLVMHSLGYESFYVSGVADGGAHAWNLIGLDGEYYHVDLTWDDLDGEPAEVLYDYFCITDEEISKTHSVDAGLIYPEADSDAYNYFVRESLTLDSFSIDAVSALAGSYGGDNAFAFRCGNEKVLADALSELIEKDKLFEIEAFKNENSYHYFMNEDLNTLYFFFD